MLHLDYDIIYKVSATGIFFSIKFLRNHVADRLYDILTTKCNLIHPFQGFLSATTIHLLLLDSLP